MPKLTSFSNAILHIDGDSFFAACEQARNPALRGKPVITGKERGIAASMSYEAKIRGVTRAMPLWEIKKFCPDVICLPSDYETYSLLSKRFYAIVRRFTPDVEEYSIDECFADITGMDKPTRLTYYQIASTLRDTLKHELGSTFSVGLAPNKVLAKVASKWQKPYGFTTITPEDIPRYLEKVPVGNIWGIGDRTTQRLNTFGVHTALQFATHNEWWVKQNFARPFYDIWRELQGETVLPLFLEEKTSYSSIQKFKTFTPPSYDPRFVFAQLSKNIENACIKLRRYNQATSLVYFILRTQDFHHRTLEITLERPTNLPPEMLPRAKEAFEKLFVKNRLYRATGVVCCNLVPMVIQDDLFGASVKLKKLQRLYAGADSVARKFGKHTLFLGTSWAAHAFGVHLTARGDEPERKDSLFIGETKRKRLGIPMLMGESV